MKAKPVILITGTKCTPEGKDKFDKWYSDKHIPDLMNGFPGIKRATRYEIAGAGGQAQKPGVKDYPTYITIYEFDSMKDFEAYDVSPQVAPFQQEAKKVLAETGTQIMWRVQYEFMKTWKK